MSLPKTEMKLKRKLFRVKKIK